MKGEPCQLGLATSNCSKLTLSSAVPTGVPLPISVQAKISFLFISTICSKPEEQALEIFALVTGARVSSPINELLL